MHKTIGGRLLNFLLKELYGHYLRIVGIVGQRFGAGIGNGCAPSVCKISIGIGASLDSTPNLRHNALGAADNNAAQVLECILDASVGTHTPSLRPCRLAHKGFQALAHNGVANVNHKVGLQGVGCCCGQRLISIASAVENRQRLVQNYRRIGFINIDIQRFAALTDDNQRPVRVAQIGQKIVRQTDICTRKIAANDALGGQLRLIEAEKRLGNGHVDMDGWLRPVPRYYTKAARLTFAR